MMVRLAVVRFVPDLIRPQKSYIVLYVATGGAGFAVDPASVRCGRAVVMHDTDRRPADMGWL